MEQPSKKYGIRGYVVMAAVFLAIHYLIQLPLFERWSAYLPLALRLSMSLALVMIILLVGKVLERVIDNRAGEEGVRYNLLRINRLLTLLFVLIVAASFLFQNLYGVVAGLGLISLILGFALQAPITSFIAWLYIVFRRPFHVGDRIEIEGTRGDVVAIRYLDTTIQEVSGPYLVNDRSSGRTVHFPNSIILRSKVINYSGQLAPFIWNETALQIAFTSDLPFVEQCLLEAARADFKERFPGRDGDNDASVYFRVNTYAWLEAVVSYQVEPEDTTGRRNRILRRALPLLNAQPDKVRFPEGTMR